MADKPTFVCLVCQLSFLDKMASDKHAWSEHPNNDIERHWAAHYKAGFVEHRGSTFYHDDPYY